MKHLRSGCECQASRFTYCICFLALAFAAAYNPSAQITCEVKRRCSTNEKLLDAFSAWRFCSRFFGRIRHRQTTSKRLFSKTMTNPISAAFVARYAVGNRILPADGFAVETGRRSITKAAAGNGIHLTRVECARTASINGNGQGVYGAKIIRCTKLGTRTKKIERPGLRVGMDSRTMRATFPAKGFHL